MFQTETGQKLFMSNLYNVFLPKKQPYGVSFFALFFQDLLFCYNRKQRLILNKQWPLRHISQYVCIYVHMYLPHCYNTRRMALYICIYSIYPSIPGYIPYITVFLFIFHVSQYSCLYSIYKIIPVYIPYIPVFLFIIHI